MVFEEEGDDEHPRADPPLPPEDRLWRHPSELADGTPPPGAWPSLDARPAPRRSLAVAALAGACLAGAAMAVGVMWLAGPTRVVTRSAEPVGARPMTTAVFAAGVVPTEKLAARLAPSLVHIEVSRGNQWTSGTGIVIDDAGTVAVATPVTVGADVIMATDHEGNRLRATPAGADDATGITILRVTDTGGVPVAASPTTAKAGQAVVVIGAASVGPDGATDQRVVTASVSAVDLRTDVDPIVLHDAVQLDRAVPDDAEGGLVVTADGALIGVVLAGSGTEDLAVVVPAGEALAAAKVLRDNGEVRRAWLGVRATDLTPSAASLMSVKGGALLTAVEAGSPAAAAGLRKGDVITQVDDQPIGDASDLVVALRAWSPGERVDVEWQRGTAVSRTGVTLGG
jgi:S1-C subfamily serine protease